jgi:osmotically-inducible protein OsmY
MTGVRRPVQAMGVSAWTGSRAVRRLLVCTLLAVGGCSGPGGSPPPLPSGVSAGVDKAAAEDIRRRWQSAPDELDRNLAVTVTNGRAVLTGRVGNPDRRVDAVRLAWQAAGVGDVVNEIQIDERTGLFDTADDTVITARLRSDLLLDEDIQSSMFTIETVNGSVYLLGRARSQAELDKVIAYARKVPRVRQVVNHVVIR